MFCSGGLWPHGLVPSAAPVFRSYAVSVDPAWQLVITSGALSSGGPGRSAVGSAITSNTAGGTGRVIWQFEPRKTRVKPAMLTQLVASSTWPLATRFQLFPEPSLTPE